MEIKNQISFLKGLGGRSILVISLLITVISVILSFFFTINQKNYMEEQLRERSNALANNLAYNSQYGVLIDNKPGLQQLINGVMNEKDIMCAFIVDRNGIVLGHNDTTRIGEIIDLKSLNQLYCTASGSSEKIVKQEEEGLIKIISPIEMKLEKSSENEEILFNRDFNADNIRDDNSNGGNSIQKKLLGVVFLGVSTENLDNAISAIQRKAFVITFFIILIGIILTIVTIRFVTQPLRKLMEATKIVAHGNLDYHVKIIRKDEIGVLANSFNQMTSDLKKSRKEIEDWNRELEIKVADRTKELIKKHRELKQYSEDLQRAYEELKTLDKAKDDFLSLVSHELRTPLSSIVAYTEVLLDDMAESKEEENSFLEIIKNESGRLTRLINNVLDLSKMEAGRMPFNFKYVALQDLVNSSVKGLSGVSGKHRQTIINNLENSSIVVYADEDKIIQVLSNILNNAMKFTPDEGVITISGSIEDKMAEVTISDTGCGIKEKDYSKVFDKFQQIEDVNHHSEGTGLGMPISKIIIENHSGKIWFDSEIHKGTTFYFTLPGRES